MKKIFTLLAVCCFAVAAQAQIHIRVQCDTAPYIWWWGLPKGENAEDLDSWPGSFKLTEKWVDTETGDEFWEWTFQEGSIPTGILFNNGGVDAEGQPVAVKQTSDIGDLNSDRYFILAWDDGDGNVDLTDVTSEYIEIPDANVTKVSLAGNHNGWSGDAQWFDVVEAGKTFQLTVNTEDYSIPENLWEFKFRPNGQAWCGYWDALNQDDYPTWLGDNGGNFLIDLEEGTTEKVFTFTATWGGGKEAGKNWTFVAKAGTTGISTLKDVQKDNNAPMYNLAGQRVNNSYRGIVIQNGKKFVK
ncbi:MAG: hypothetical protein IJJ68_04700 [Prevotella sp.]|nr:hypothetical protein [Prevotella sp.]